MINMNKCKHLFRLIAIIVLAMTVLLLTSCDVVSPILENLGINIGGAADNKDDVGNDNINDGNNGNDGADNGDNGGNDNNNNDNNDNNQGDNNDNNQGDNNDNNQGGNGGNQGGTGDGTQDECEHVWGEGEIITRPTCGTDEKGISRSTCTKCFETLDTEIDARDIHSTEKVILTEAKCGVDGLEMEKCVYCDYSKKTVIAATPHTIEFMEVPGEDEKYGYVCTSCNAVESYVEVVTYTAFGAVGDGVTDDSEAIRAAHKYANENGLPVYAKAGATYYIGVLDETIVIYTDTNWNGATLIFDDSQIMWDDKNHRGVNVFTIYPDGGARYHSVPEGMSLSKGQTNIGMTFDAPCLLKIVNKNEKIYIRYGENANSGVDKSEVILVDENGNVDPSTPIQYDYKELTSLIQFSVNEKPISVGNGKIITRVPDPKYQDPDYENNYCYFSRGIMVQRSNTTIYNIEHVIEGEMMTIEIDRNGDGVVDKWGADKSYGVPYAGFFNFKYCYNATMTDCIVQGHQAYSFWQGTVRNEMGSYDLSATDCVNLNLLNLTQYENEATGETIINRFMYHGVMGSNFCRNVVMDNCYLDRFDSHQGLHNARITNSTLGFGILVIGGGELYIENVYRISGDCFIGLRTDYNSIFDGDVIIKNCSAGVDINCILSGVWRSFYNGIPNWVTRSLTIDGLTVSLSKFYLYKINGAAMTALTDSVNPIFIPEAVQVSNVRQPNGSEVEIFLSSYSDAFSTIELNPDPFDSWLKKHVWDEGVIITPPSTTDCTPGLIRYTCTECGEVGERVIASEIPHASLEYTVSDGVITYNCTVCDHAFTPEKGYFMDGTDHNAMMGVGNSTNFNTVANNNQNPLINENGEYQLLKKTSKSTSKFQIWIPSTDPNFKDLSAKNNATGYLSFKINAYTDKDLFMRFVDSKSNISTDRWTEKGCIVDAFFAVSAPDSNGVVAVIGWDDFVLASINVGDDKFTGWFDVKIVMELSSEDDSVTLHYYIDGQYVYTASRELTTSNDLIDSVYIEGNTKAKNSGILLDDIAFGCTYRKCMPA